MDAKNGALNGKIWAQKILASASGTLQTLGMNVGAAVGNGRLALYSHNSGSNKPNSLLAEKGSFALALNWNDHAPSTLPGIVQGTYYWIAFQMDNSSGQLWDNIGGRRSQANQAYGAFPATWPTSTEYDNVTQFNLRMTYASPVVPPTVTTQAATGIGLD